MKRTITVAVVVAVAVGIGLAWRFGNGKAPGAMVAVSVPRTLTPLAQEGQRAFEANCAQCHGVNAAGSPNGPPLVHDIYNPGHHADAAFFMAARRGARSHHWRFGDMPPQPQVTDSQIKAIVSYVRALQVANGIVYKKHVM